LCHCGPDPVGPISTKIGTVVWVDEVIIQSNFDFNSLVVSDFSSTVGQNFQFSRFNGTAATAQTAINN